MANKEIKKYRINKQALYSLMKERNVTVKELGTTYYDSIQRTPSTLNRYLEIDAMPLALIINLALFFDVSPEIFVVNREACYLFNLCQQLGGHDVRS